MRSGLIASLFSRASGELAVVDAIAIADHLIPECVVHPLMTEQRIQIAVIYNNYKPLSPQALLFRDFLLRRLQDLLLRGGGTLGQVVKLFSTGRKM